MANLGDTLPHCSGTGASDNPYIFSTEEGFKEAIEVNGAYVEASQSGLSFDANNGVFKTLNFYCRNIEGKGLTVRNLLSFNENTNLIKTCLNGASCTVVINDINFYNMCIYNYNDTSATNDIHLFIKTSELSGTGNYSRFNRCNFTGVYKGYTRPMFESKCYNQFSYDTLYFMDCTFNINLDLKKNGLGDRDGFYVFGGLDGHDTYVINNCTICLSGVNREDDSGRPLQLMRNVTLLNSVLTNSQSNPLTCPTTGTLGQVALNLKSNSTYSYCKLYITRPNAESGANLNVSNASQLLCNVSRTGTVSGTAIKMQETNPLSENHDYIYSADDLAYQGFIVGQVIT